MTAGAPRLVFVDGHLVPQLGTLDPSSGLEVRDLDAYWLQPEATRGARLSTAAHPLAALNTAYAQSGAWLRVAAGARIDGAARDRARRERRAEARRAAAARHRDRSRRRRARSSSTSSTRPTPRAGSTSSPTSRSPRIRGSRSIRIQEHGYPHAHTSLLAVDLAARASASLGLFDLGGRLVRNDIDVKLREPGAALDLYGLLLAGEGQHVDDHTRIDHIAPDTRSTEAFRGVIGQPRPRRVQRQGGRAPRRARHRRAADERQPAALAIKPRSTRSPSSRSIPTT